MSLRIGVAASDTALLSHPTGGVTVAPRFDWRGSGAEGFVEVAGSAFRGGSIVQLTARDAHTRGMFVSEGTLEAGFISSGTSTGRLQQAFGAGHRFGRVLLSGGLAAGALRDIGGTFRAQASGRLGLGYAFADLKAQRFDAGAGFRYTDIVAQMSAGSTDFAAVSTGVRIYDEARRTFTFRFDAAKRLTPALQAEVSFGKTARSPEGFSEGGYALAGIRVIAARAIHPPEIQRNATGVRVTFDVTGNDVRIAGDWNDWQPAPVVHGVVELPIMSGAHKFTLTVDGKTVIPKGVPRLPDGFGGEVGLLVL